MLKGGFAEGTMIMTPLGEVPVETIAVGDLVTTPGGPRPVVELGWNNIRRRAFEVEFQFRCSVICPNDNCFSSDHQWIRTDKLQVGQTATWGRGGHSPILFDSAVSRISPIAGGKIVHTFKMKEDRGFFANGALVRAY